MSVWVVAVVAAAVVLTWRRLFVGMDLQDESFYVLVPWRWALGDRPFVDEQNLAQAPALLTYPFVKAFALVRGHDVTGLVLYSRHVYLLLMIGVAVIVFLLVRRLVRWQAALLVSAVTVTYVYWATPQLSYNTLAIAFLTVSAALAALVVIGKGGRAHALAAGAALGAAVVAYPTLLFIVPFWAVLLMFATGRRGARMIADGAFLHPPDPPGPPRGRDAWRILSAWVAGGAMVLVPMAILALSFGPANLMRSWQWTMAIARLLQQVGGGWKAISVAEGVWRFITWRPYMLVGALLIYLVYSRRPRLGRGLLAVLPLALWLAAQRPQVWAAGYVIVYVLLAPYLYLFVPSGRRETGARLLISIWAPSMMAGAMTAYTSASGYLAAAVGMAPAVVVSGVFLCWALEAVSEKSVVAGNVSTRDGAGGVDTQTDALLAVPRSDTPALGTWLAVGVLVVVLGVTVSFQFRFQQRDVPLEELTSRFSSGPWWGISVTPERRALMDGFESDLAAQGRDGDELLIFEQGAGFYLYWDGSIAANTYWLSLNGAGDLPQPTISYYRRHRIVPTLVVHLGSTVGKSRAALQTGCAGLDYPPTLVRPAYAFQRKPPGESTAEVLLRLPRAVGK